MLVPARVPSALKNDSDLGTCIPLAEADNLDHMFADIMQPTLRAVASGGDLVSICHLILD